MKDFIGNDIEIGSYVACPGAGNITAEYGQLLMKVTGFNPKSISVERLDVDYDYSNRQRTTIIVRKKAYVRNKNKLVVIQPHPAVIEFFENPNKNPELIAKWIHGNDEFDSLGLLV